MKTTDVLQKLIRACVDDQRTLQHESERVDERRAETLRRMADERAQFVSELERLDEHVERRPNGSWAELLREVGRDVWVAAAGRNTGDAIAICRHSRARTEARYDRAMQQAWPEQMQRLLTMQRHRLHEETAVLNQMQF